MKSKADPVFMISMVGVDKYGFVDEHEHIYDIYTKAYDFCGYEVQVKSAQDLLKYYQSKTGDTKKVDIYFLVEFFVKNHPNGHFILDECPLFSEKGYIGKLYKLNSNGILMIKRL